MSLRRRVEDLEERVGRPEDTVVTVVVDGVNDDSWRARAEAARARGNRLRFVRIAITNVAETVEQAEAIIAKHREAGPRIPITIWKSGSIGKERLARWSPPLPDWLGDVVQEEEAGGGASGSVRPRQDENGPPVGAHDLQPAAVVGGLEGGKDAAEVPGVAARAGENDGRPGTVRSDVDRGLTGVVDVQGESGLTVRAEEGQPNGEDGCAGPGRTRWAGFEYGADPSTIWLT